MESYVFAGMVPGDAYYFDQVMDVAVDGEGNVYIAEQFKHRITKLSAEGEVLDKWTGDATFSPKAIAASSDGIVYAAAGDGIMAIDMASDEPLRTWTSPGMSVTGLAVDTESGVVYATDNTYENNSVWRLDLNAEADAFEQWTGFNDETELENETETPFDYPTDVAVGPEGNVYVADQSNRIVKLNEHGAYLGMMDADGQFDSLRSIAVDQSGFLYAADSEDDGVVVFDDNGDLVHSIGGEGMGAGEFNYPQGIAVSTDGQAYVADTSNRRVQKLVLTADESEGAELEVVDVWGTYGPEEGQFFIPEGIAVDSAGRVYVADQGNERIQMFDAGLTFMASRDGGGSSFLPFGLAVDGEGSLYMTSGGALLKYVPAENVVSQLNEWGTLSDPTELAIDADGFIYVADTGGHKIVKFDSTGQMVDEMVGVDEPNNFYFRPVGIAVDSERNIVYSADGKNIQTFNTDGEQLDENWGQPEGGAFGNISGIALDGEGNLFVADEGSYKIHKFNPAGELMASWGSKGSGAGEFDGVSAVAVDALGNVYVTDGGNNHRMQKFAPLTYSVSFESNGGTAVAAQAVKPGAVASEPAVPTRNGYTFGGWYADSALSQAYSFEASVTGELTLYAKWTANPIVLPDNGNETPSVIHPEPNQPNQGTNDFLINGKPGKASVKHATDEDGRKVTTISVEWDKGNQSLAGEESPVLLLQSDTGSDVLAGELSGELLQALIDRQGVIELRTGSATYTLPAGRLDLEAVLKQLGSATLPADAVLRIEVSRATGELARLLNDRAEAEGFKVVVPPVHFTIWLTYGDATIELKTFNGYVKRTLTLPSGSGLNRSLTGIVVGPDGTVRHVPTRLSSANGARAAEINSLTNSAYAVVSYSVSFSDAENHWAKPSIHDLGSRMIIKGTGAAAFSPDQAITRAEFAAIIVRALGLPVDSGSYQGKFADVDVNDWYADAVQTAYSYGLVGGYEDGTFRPQDNISREQAMKILADAMLLTGLLGEDADISEGVEQLNAFEDAADVSTWARDSVAA
ncbi:MAG: inlA, partial [Paenibacillus sp.]|nr:inlA [Paenibacillus sp.]